MKAEAPPEETRWLRFGVGHHYVAPNPEPPALSGIKSSAGESGFARSLGVPVKQPRRTAPARADNELGRADQRRAEAALRHCATSSSSATSARFSGASRTTTRTTPGSSRSPSSVQRSVRSTSTSPRWIENPSSACSTRMARASGDRGIHERRARRALRGGGAVASPRHRQAAAPAQPRTSVDGGRQVVRGERLLALAQRTGACAGATAGRAHCIGSRRSCRVEGAEPPGIRAGPWKPVDPARVSKRKT